MTELSSILILVSQMTILSSFVIPNGLISIKVESFLEKNSYKFFTIFSIYSFNFGSKFKNYTILSISYSVRPFLGSILYFIILSFSISSIPIPPSDDAITIGHAFYLSNIIDKYNSYLIFNFSTTYTVLHGFPFYPDYLVTKISFNIYYDKSFTY